MDINLQNGSKMKHLFQLTALSTALVVAGCGGGGGGGFYGPSTPPTTTTPTPVVVPSSIAISQTKASLSTGGDSVDLTLRIVDANGGIVANAPVTLSIADIANSGASLSSSSSVTSDSTGLVKTTLTLASDKVDYRINHDIVLTATVIQGGATVTQNFTIPASGTHVTVTSDTSSLSVGQNANVTVTAVDAKGGFLSGTTVKLLDAKGAAFGNSQTTNANGSAVFVIPASTVAATTGGQLALTAQVVGSLASRTQSSDNNVVLSAQTVNQTLSFTSATSTSTEVNSNATVTVQAVVPTQDALTGKTIAFATSKGTLSSATSPISNIVKNADGTWTGTATVTLTSVSPGTASITASFGANSITGTTEFVSSTAKTVTLQSDLAVISPTASTQVVALVKDVNGAPVKNASVNFFIKSDPSAGKLSSALALTDSSGQAIVTYTAGATATQNNAVDISATATSVNNLSKVSASDLLLTVAGQSAYITVAQSNTIDGTTYNVYYLKDFSSSVVDIVGKPITSQQVSIALVPKTFLKGYWNYDTVPLVGGGTKSLWVQHVTATCNSNEFQNPVTLLAGGNVLGTSATYTTDAQGKFDYQVRYGKNYATWLTLTMNASTRVGTSQNLTSLYYSPALLATDIDDSGKISLPSMRSPYGVGTNCNDSL